MRHMLCGLMIMSELTYVSGAHSHQPQDPKINVNGFVFLCFFQTQPCQHCAWLLQELLGHCLALYQTNQQLACKLEDHLQQFGYTKSSVCEEEPEDPCSLAITSDHGMMSMLWQAKGLVHFGAGLALFEVHL